jgi:hypothetical protein
MFIQISIFICQQLRINLKLFIQAFVHYLNDHSPILLLLPIWHLEFIPPILPLPNTTTYNPFLVLMSLIMHLPTYLHHSTALLFLNSPLFYGNSFLSSTISSHYTSYIDYSGIISSNASKNSSSSESITWSFYSSFFLFNLASNMSCNGLKYLLLIDLSLILIDLLSLCNRGKTGLNYLYLTAILL